MIAIITIDLFYPQKVDECSNRIAQGMKELDDMETDENKEYVNIVTWEWALSHGNGP